MKFDLAQPICLFLCGDVMTGRGIDQILPHPGNPTLYETYVRDAREYMHLAEAVHGPIACPVGFDYIWGDVLEVLKRAGTEGISGSERFRGDLALMYLVKVDPREGRLVEARLVPLQSRQFRLRHASAADAKWLCDLLNALGVPFTTQVELNDDNSLTLRYLPFGEC